MVWEETAINLGVIAVQKFFESIGKKKDEDFISIGLSVGYFYNFLDPVSDKINSGDFKIYKSPDDKEPILFNPEDIKLTVIIPEKLDVYAFKACEDEFRKYIKGNIYLNKHSRWYGINYGITQTANGHELEIIDLSRPIFAVKQYYEQILKRNTDINDEKWLHSQLSEISAFKESLKRLQGMGYGVLVNKLSFRSIG